MLHDPRTAWVTLVVSIVLTALAWYISDRSQTKLLKERFVFRTTEVETAIVQRMKQYELVLRGGVALFEASEAVTRDEWRAYVQALHFREHYPGIQAVGFSQRIPRESKDAHVAALRAQGHDDYAIAPAGERDEYHSIIYIEPFDARNQRAFGFDMHTEPTRRAAMDQARDSGQTSVSGVVTLKQETEHDVQQGFLMYIPVFANGAPRTTVEERRKTLRGFVYAAFRGRDLMGGIFGGKFADLDYWIFDGTGADPRALVFQNHPGAVLRPDADLSWTSHVEVAGHPWTVRFSSSSSRFEPGRAQPLLIAFGGLLIDVLLFVIVGSLARTQDRAVHIANQMTAELRRSLKEKDILLQEVHHRVKNNLQMISSLIGLQLRKLDSASAQAALEECQGRVLAIALIHEKLYQVAGGAGIQFADYVRDLATSVAAAAEDGAGRVKLEFAVQPLALEVGQAIPCGLIVQELLSNVFKHAYEDGAKGTVTVELVEHDGLVTLAVGDDGVGFPDDFDPHRAASLGLRLVRMLSEQLEAELQTSNGRGARTAIRFARQAPAEMVAS
ncbi:MAG TPA: CHASE domain-containing protein [Polyangiales bacterium]|nr:CHASE domain-containing protein [Polyangiales bacterium]